MGEVKTMIIKIFKKPNLLRSITLNHYITRRMASINPERIPKLTPTEDAPSLWDYRKEYIPGQLGEKDMSQNPFDQFKAWFDKANEVEKFCEPNTMAISTATASGVPSVRYVLLKGVDTSGFTFFTHYESRKGQNLEENPNIAALFYWPLTHRQIRLEGTVEKLSDKENDDYFHSRPVGSQISAWASPQSQKIPSKDPLLEKMSSMQKKVETEGVEVPRPNWGGYRIIPKTFEFWQGQQSRDTPQGWDMHNRFMYRRTATGGWAIEMIAT